MWEQWTATVDFGGPLAWPIGGHEYLPDAPVIYTYRHPIEAYLSFVSRALQDVGKPVAEVYLDDNGSEVVDFENTKILTVDEAARNSMYQIGKHWSIYEKLKAEQTAGRDVLFLRYESFYGHDVNRIREITNFTGADIDDPKFIEILEYVDIALNEARGAAMAKDNPSAVFSGHCNEKSGIQRYHVNKAAKGIPGYHMKTQEPFVREVLKRNQPAYQALCEMCEAMGYEPGKI